MGGGRRDPRILLRRQIFDTFVLALVWLASCFWTGVGSAAPSATRVQRTTGTVGGMHLQCIRRAAGGERDQPSAATLGFDADLAVNSTFFHGKLLFGRFGRPIGVIDAAAIGPDLVVRRVLFVPLDSSLQVYCAVDAAAGVKVGRNGLRLPVTQQSINLILMRMGQLWQKYALDGQ
ncbi:MAG: hypothetical protein GC186_16660 [Rhodobacteraceae bacterium]|nr:hypothetical protein [Paracoccaceae bacterium]